MLRRDFIKSAGLAVGGAMIFDNLAFAEEFVAQETNAGRRPRTYHFHGHPRSGCATRPELAPFLEKGFCVMPPL